MYSHCFGVQWPSGEINEGFQSTAIESTMLIWKPSLIVSIKRPYFQVQFKISISYEPKLWKFLKNHGVRKNTVVRIAQGIHPCLEFILPKSEGCWTPKNVNLLHLRPKFTKIYSFWCPTSYPCTNGVKFGVEAAKFHPHRAACRPAWAAWQKNLQISRVIWIPVYAMPASWR